MVAIGEITELSIRKKDGMVTMELKFLNKEGEEYKLIINDEKVSKDDDKSKLFLINGHETGPIETESSNLLYKYSYPLRNYLIDLFGWK